MGTEERRMMVKVGFGGDRSSKRDVMRVYWVDSFIALDDVFA
jgi:hypothetical protein